jgi:uncharacterized protein (TIGR02466 family)|tara:strand:- start:1885 stop:2532 length:648 start_codon:yes stop_codon:yes gene_type:complete
MDHQVAGYFATPVVAIKLTDKENERLKDLFYKKIRNKDYKDIGRNPCDTLTHYYNVFKNFREVRDIFKKLETMANFVYKDVMNHTTDLFIKEHWFNYAKRNSSQHFHAHANSVLSGTIFIDVDEDYLIFKTPFDIDRTPPHMNTIVDEPSYEENKLGYTFHSPEVSAGVANGTVLFWPSYLRHGYQDTKKEGRLTLSFNCFPKSFNHDYSIGTYT